MDKNKFSVGHAHAASIAKSMAKIVVPDGDLYVRGMKPYGLNVEIIIETKQGFFRFLIDEEEFRVLEYELIPDPRTPHQR